MANINLHSIFRHLVGDNDFLSKVISTENKGMGISKKKKKSSFDIMANIVMEYVPLAPYEIQPYSQFPEKIKSILSPDYARKGIKNITERGLNPINISFLNSLNMLLRPELYPLGLEEHLRNLALLEEFILHKIERNYLIDRTKRTKKVQAANKEIAKKLKEGKFSHEIIQYIINVFEINLIVIDFISLDIYFYWTHGTKYPYLNLFKNLYCMAYIQGNYEPIMPTNQIIPHEQIQKMYIHILTNITEIKCFEKVNLALHSLEQLNSWNISFGYASIIENFYSRSRKTKDDIIKEWKALTNNEKSKSITNKKNTVSH